MPKVDPTKLVPGDIVLFEWKDHFWHTAIYVGDVAAVKGGIAHCDSELNGTLIAQLATDYGVAENVYAFRLPVVHANVLKNVMALVQTWAPVKVVPGLSTTYSTPRGSAVLKQYDKQDPKAPPFEYDALFRVFKWLDQRTRFSKTQGTTCCAFVMACFQAGMMKTFIEQKGLTECLGAIRTKLGGKSGERAGKQKPDSKKAEEIFRAEIMKRGTSKQTAAKVPFKDLDKFKIMARREYSNPGSKKKELFKGVDALWDEIKKDVCYLYDDDTTLEQIMTAPLFCDAKFTYSHTLYKRLRVPPSTWTQVPCV